MKIGLKQISEAKEALTACLSKVPFLRMAEVASEIPISGTRLDLVLTLNTPNGDQKLIVEVKSQGYPRDLRLASMQLRRYQAALSGAYAVIAAPYISSAGAAVCTEEGVGYVDFAGNCRLCFDGVFIERSGVPNPYAESRQLKSIYMPKAERILRVMLSHPKRSWRTQALAAEAKVSLGQVSNVKKLLESGEWLKDTEGGIALARPALLLEEWAKNYDPSRSTTRMFYSLRPIPDIEAELPENAAELGTRSALSGFSGAARLAPHVRYQRGSAYVDTVSHSLLESFDLKEVGSGANFSLIEPYDEGVYYGGRAIDGTRVVSPIQLYLDLRHTKGRGEEAAEALLKKVIEPTWA